MRFPRLIAASVAALLLVPVVTSASPQGGNLTTPAKPKAPVKPAKVATHATSGVIRAIDGSTLVIAKSTKATATETFELTSETARKGELAVGNKVSLRYTNTGGRLVATAVTVSGKGKSSESSH